MPENLPFVSVIIPVLRNWEKLLVCLQHLERQDYDHLRYEIIVVNNSTEQFPRQLKEKHPRIILLNEPKPGSYAARNLGIARSRGEILAFTDSDCLPQTNWISEAVTIFTDSPTTHLLGGKIEVFYETVNKPTAFSVYEKLFSFQQKRYVELITLLRQLICSLNEQL